MEAERAVFLEHQMKTEHKKLGKMGTVTNFLGLQKLVTVPIFPSFLCSVLLLSAPLTAHHGTGGIYNMDKPVTLKGTITMFKFVNPHVLLYFDVPDKGAVVNWLGEGPSVNNWTKTGWNRNSVKAGDSVTVTLYPARNGKPEGVVHKVVTANGKEWCCETK
jgi:uncharacterized protein DUF6152